MAVDPLEPMPMFAEVYSSVARNGHDDAVEAETQELGLAHEAGVFEPHAAENPRDKRDERDNRSTVVTSVTNVPWETPAPLRRATKLPAFPVAAFPAWVGDQVRAVSHFTQTPIDLPATVGLATLATAIGGRVQVRVRGSWVEPTNLFIVSALPPGSRKSAVFAAMSKPIYQAESVLVGETEPVILEAQTLIDVTKARMELAKKKAAKAETPVEKSAEEMTLRELFEALGEAEKELPPRPRLVVDDITPEACASLLGEQGGRLGVLSAEGGIFSILAGRYSNGVPNLDIFLKGHAGDHLRIDRRSSAPIIVDDPALTLGLTVQPEILRQIHGMPGFRGRGLLARILYSLPVNTVGWRQVDVDAPAVEIANDYETKMRELAMLMHGVTKDENGKYEPPDPIEPLQLSAEGEKVLLEAARELEPRLRRGADLGYLVDWGSKLIGATARIAGLLHIADYLGGTLCDISSECMGRAIEIGRYFEAHAIAAFDEMGADPAIDGARLILNWVHRQELNQFTRREAHRGCRNFKSVTELDACLDLLEHHGYIRGRRIVPEGGGRPSVVFDVNPYVTDVTDVTNEGTAA
jgi:replicative DNA helicase